MATDCLLRGTLKHWKKRQLLFWDSHNHPEDRQRIIAKRENISEQQLCGAGCLDGVRGQRSEWADWSETKGTQITTGDNPGEVNGTALKHLENKVS